MHKTFSLQNEWNDPKYTKYMVFIAEPNIEILRFVYIRIRLPSNIQVEEINRGNELLLLSYCLPDKSSKYRDNKQCDVWVARTKQQLVPFNLDCECRFFGDEPYDSGLKDVEVCSVAGTMLCFHNYDQCLPLKMLIYKCNSGFIRRDHNFMRENGIRTAAYFIQHRNGLQSL